MHIAGLITVAPPTLILSICNVLQIATDLCRAPRFPALHRVIGIRSPGRSPRGRKNARPALRRNAGPGERVNQAATIVA